VDHLSGGRLILGVGAGNAERDYLDYGIPWGTPGERLRLLAEALPRIKERLGKLNPGPMGPLPLLIGGGGERKTLRLVAQCADMSNTGGTPDVARHKNQVIDDWCEQLGRDPTTIERTTNIPLESLDQIDAYVDAGIQRFQVQLNHPFDLKPLEPALKLRDA
jgi:alkanesulfonate monooxygenase SsuD/methylene tetrahydromethanopterin reductase-like flavin-dependent oxidoreductase (luciferase family)